MYFTDDSLYPENMQPLIITAAPYAPSRLGNRNPTRRQGGGVPRPRLVLRRDHRNDNECSRLRSRLVTRQKSSTQKSWSPLHGGYLTKQYEKTNRSYKGDNRCRGEASVLDICLSLDRAWFIFDAQIDRFARTRPDLS
jgi:hypothetical protein